MGYQAIRKAWVLAGAPPSAGEDNPGGQKGASDMEIKVQKLGQEELKKMGVFAWSIWTKEVSRFDWQYDSVEECYILEGEVVVEPKEGKKVSFGKGDFVTFPKGLSCVWDIKKPVRKHYNFR